MTKLKTKVPTKKSNGIKQYVSCRLAYDELRKKNDYFAMSKALGFKEPYYGQNALHNVRHLINWSDVETVVGWLFENGYDVTKPNVS
jgi:hypothetical protein